MLPATRGAQPSATANRIDGDSPRDHAWKKEILTDSMENPHFLRIQLRDMQDNLVLGKDSTGPLSPQQHDGHVLKVYGGEKMERGDTSAARGNHPSETCQVSSHCG